MAFLAGCASTATRATDDPAVQLAILDHGRDLDDDSEEVAEYRDVLSRLEGKCRERPVRKVADMAVFSHQELEDEGTGSVPSLLEILGYVDEIVPVEAGRVRCDEVFAAWLTLALRGAS